MKARSVSLLIGPLLLVMVSTASAATAVAGSATGAIVSSAVSDGHATAEAVVTGPNAVIAVNGDRVEIKQGRLSLNGVPYGTVDERSVVIYRVTGVSKTLLVDGRERRPLE
ncbi:hypothetical protein FIU83_02585 [Halomonas sp. THAF5a]|uniref:sugar ABC transporter ATPase n=1 Tax=Halomonas sp. THAF5a TaxID=2587844 RepID=UPI0012A8C275|nr:sugar ABC transporter ATPase [Halomonas sp. THAF5a]QFU00525.1 hypothetical protein FIU83_02585 [Halomonas sp. THAF5a]